MATPNKLEVNARYLATPRGQAAAKRANLKCRSGPRGKFIKQRVAARERGIDWQLTFDQWWELWAPHWEKRGTCRACLVMARNGDIGPYAVGNVRIDTVTNNVREQNEIRRTA